MFSGVPAKIRLGHYRRIVTRFLYVGTLRYSKNVHKIIQAFAISSLDAWCSLEIVGSGPDEEELKQLPFTLDLARRVTFLGKVSREKVFERMKKSDCLIMVSKETFGMVYIEAMSQGCIVVAAKGQGIDGIIVDGENGFLAPLNDTNALAKIIYRISRLNENEVSRLSKNAIATAAQMTDDVLAYNLLERLKSYTRGGK
jgi:glycosyltransferase involved in cell wall biosynthesis